MRVYIAYKYRAVEDKNKLISDLERISSAIKASEHHPFILGRDVQKWHASAVSVYKTIPHIVLNVFKSDILFIYLDNGAKSRGLPFELYCAKLFKKPVILAKKEGTNIDLKGIKPIQTIEFNDIDDLLSKIPTLAI